MSKLLKFGSITIIFILLLCIIMILVNMSDESTSQYGDLSTKKPYNKNESSNISSPQTGSSNSLPEFDKHESTTLTTEKAKPDNSSKNTAPTERIVYIIKENHYFYGDTTRDTATSKPNNNSSAIESSDVTSYDSSEFTSSVPTNSVETSSDVSSNSSIASSLPTSQPNSSKPSKPDATYDKVVQEVDRIMAKYNVIILFDLPSNFTDMNALYKCVSQLELVFRSLEPKYYSDFGVSSFVFTDDKFNLTDSAMLIPYDSIYDDIYNKLLEYIGIAITDAKINANIWRYNPDDIEYTRPNSQYLYNSNYPSLGYFLNLTSQVSQSREILELTNAIIHNEPKLHYISTASPLYKKLKLLCPQLVKKFPSLVDNFIVKQIIG